MAGLESLAGRREGRDQAAGARVAPAERPQRARAQRGPPHEPRQRHRAPVVRDEQLVHEPGARPDRALRPRPDALPDRVYVLPKHLDEKVARLHLDALGVELTELTPEQAAYIGVAGRGPVQGRPLPLLSRRRDAASSRHPAASSLGEPVRQSRVEHGRERARGARARGASAASSRSRRSDGDAGEEQLGRRRPAAATRTATTSCGERRGERGRGVSGARSVACARNCGDAPGERVGHPRDVGGRRPARRARGGTPNAVDGSARHALVLAVGAGEQVAEPLRRGVEQADERGEAAERQVDLDDADEGADEARAGSRSPRRRRARSRAPTASLPSDLPCVSVSTAVGSTTMQQHEARDDDRARSAASSSPTARRARAAATSRAAARRTRCTSMTRPRPAARSWPAAGRGRRPRR